MMQRFSQLALLLSLSLPSLARPINDTLLSEYDYISKLPYAS